MNFIERYVHQFDTRILFKGALININGETLDCQVTKLPNGNYAIESDGKAVCDPVHHWHITPSPFSYGVPADMFQLKMASNSDGDATLILPLLFARQTEDQDDEELV